MPDPSWRLIHLVQYLVHQAEDLGSRNVVYRLSNEITMCDFVPPEPDLVCSIPNILPNQLFLEQFVDLLFEGASCDPLILGCGFNDSASQGHSPSAGVDGKALMCLSSHAGDRLGDIGVDSLAHLAWEPCVWAICHKAEVGLAVAPRPHELHLARCKGEMTTAVALKYLVDPLKLAPPATGEAKLSVVHFLHVAAVRTPAALSDYSHGCRLGIGWPTGHCFFGVRAIASSIALRARSWLDGMRCAYTRSVRAGSACPRYSLTALMLSPASSNTDA